MEDKKIAELEHDLDALKAIQKELYQKLYNIDININSLRMQLNALK